MTPAELRTVLARLEISQVGLAAFVGVDPRTARRWAAGDIPVPKAVALILRFLDARKMAPEKFEKIAQSAA